MTLTGPRETFRIGKRQVFKDYYAIHPYTDPPLQIEGFQIGSFAFDLDLGCRTNRDVTRRWLERRLEVRSDCGKANLLQLTTRVIDAGPNEARILDSIGAMSNYTALGHC